MITKITKINNLAVFKNFEWDKVIRDKGNNISKFTKVNIIYGRNYSGKTTLSRIVRSLETKKLSEKYEDPDFEVEFDSNNKITLQNIEEQKQIIRVFNEDFVKENLRFISNPEENITSFAILGENNSIEEEIEELKEKLGRNEEGNKSGLYLELEKKEANKKLSEEEYNNRKKSLESKIQEKAINKQTGIKYHSNIFGDQNYNSTKLKEEIEFVLTEKNFLTEKEKADKLALLKETIKIQISPIIAPEIDLQTLNNKVKEVVTRLITPSNKIEELVKIAVLNRWVKEGRKIHKENDLKECSFCGNKISEERWEELDKHFDEESEKLEKEIDSMLQEVDSYVTKISDVLPIDKNLFYTNFQNELEQLIEEKDNCIKKIVKELNSLKKILESRKQDLLNIQSFSDIQDFSKELNECITKYNRLVKESNSYSQNLSQNQENAKKVLRLKEVADFARDIQYSKEKAEIDNLKIKWENSSDEEKEVNDKITEVLDLISNKERERKDEEAGAKKVNEYLNNFFGHSFLTLQALKDKDEEKSIYFEVVRNGKKAYHLSEGECSLISFCYFMAKLEDIGTKDMNPIIWIDDPISSLDGNHIFFVYSLISSEIIQPKKIEQLFISTHNLDFLKYLKRFSNYFSKKESQENIISYFLLARERDESNLIIMPNYLKNYVTEFNYLFHQIYKCSIAEENDIDEHSLFYNFANNTRKFLEAFLFYKYPNADINDKDKLLKFFGGDKQAVILVDRIDNEYSHLEGLFERSMKPVDVPEMRKMAQYILRKIEEKDKEQYDSLLKSIGECKK
ncbi:AAA family ATPase [uncultured Capnocytophaga sp.]|uniref:AAA family ATPase n=1 Tax=uncultured Capnocytophaga sp. TaxID=159273 RepID=UPI002611365E|nr:AAA family ATPase [uncultured Capnocytophaga sp.]